MRGYAQKDPKQEYKKESFELFSMMLDGLKRDVVKVLFNVKLQGMDDVPNDDEMFDDVNINNADNSHNEPVSLLQVNTTNNDEEKISRNAACPCGSGKKYKHCHGQLN